LAFQGGEFNVLISAPTLRAAQRALLLQIVNAQKTISLNSKIGFYASTAPGGVSSRVVPTN